MGDTPEAPANRLERRKQRTRGALIKAAQTLIAQGRLAVPVLEITQLADVGMGSFYNHFDSKEDLFEAAVTDVMDSHGAMLDVLTAEMADPAETFAASFRLTGRFFRRRPQESSILLANWSGMIDSDTGLAPRARRDIEAATRAGRFHVEDPDLGLAIAAGVLLGVGNLLRNDPDRDDEATVDAAANGVLRLFGMSDDDARAVCSRALPPL